MLEVLVAPARVQARAKARRNAGREALPKGAKHIHFPPA